MRMLLADYVAVDEASSKLSVVGGGLSVLGILNSGNTAPFGAYVSVTVPPAHYHARCQLRLALEDSSARPVLVPTLPPGAPEPLRLDRDLEFPAPKLPHGTPADFLPTRIQLAVGFPIGLPLTPGGYRWRISIDGESRDGWTEDFIAALPGGSLVVNSLGLQTGESS